MNTNSPALKSSEIQAEAIAPGPRLKKLVVAVHGIGKQFRYATIQSVVGRFGSYCKCPVPVPLGNFHFEGKDAVGALRIPDPPYSPTYPPGLVETGFAEIFWADIPGEAVNAADTLEETKAWAKTVVERVRVLDLQANKRESVNYKKTSAVIDEMISTIGVLENLLLLARKCGICSFDLQKLLTDYVGDIQIVTEFANYRTRILDHFHTVLQKLDQRHQPDEIHVIAHSEGTVIAFLGLLQAMSRKAPPNSGWVDKVVGFMTIGSPIDKHLVMWPRLWDNLQPARSTNRKRPIDWRNYFDHGDPVGFELDTAREWLIDGGWMTKQPARSDLFHFPKDPEHDCGFTRYAFPGKAHNDYWQDDAVFCHFIRNVMDPPSAGGTRPSKPRDSQLLRIVSWTLPYVVCFLILLAGTYVLYKPVSQFVNPNQGLSVMVSNVVAIAALLAGMTVLARVPRLARCFWKYSLSAVAFVLSAVIYKWLIDPAANDYLGLYFTQHFGWPSETAIVWVMGIAGVICGLLSYKVPRVGLKAVVVMVGAAAAAVIWGVVTGPGKLPNSADKPAIWPLVISGAAFLYLWWLSALLFDLVFVWHRYIRSSLAVKFLRTCNTKRRQTERALGSGPAAVAVST